MPSFHHGDVEIAYLDEGEGDPIVLVHGFASSKNVNWVYPTWVSELRKNGRRVIAFDNRGHGDSSKLYDPEDYHIGTMASDITALMNHLGIERADVMGYSLGARMMGILAQTKPQRVRSAIFGGLGIGLIKGGGPGENVAKALEAPSLDDVTDPVGRTFRAFADQTRSDRRALAACERPMTVFDRSPLVHSEEAMSRECEVTGKKPLMGSNVSHSNRHTKKRFEINLVTKRFWLEDEKRWITLRVTTRGMRTIDKRGLAAVVKDLRAAGKKI